MSGTVAIEISTTLTPSEYRVVELVARGYNNRQIGRELSVSESTVKKHVSAALTKHSCDNRVQLALEYWARHSPAFRRNLNAPAKVAA